MKHYYIVREGWPFAGVALALFIITMAIGLTTLIVVSGLLFIFVSWFFRNPKRIVPEGEGLIISPADGRVISVSESEGSKISIFMSIFNVHINRAPLNGIVKKVEYNKGKFLVASLDKASFDNEQNAVTVEDAGGRQVRFVQIAGLVARRIVCYLRPGDRVVMGSPFGLIRFGSRVDVYLPNDYKVSVKVNDRVKGGVSILGTLK